MASEQPPAELAEWHEAVEASLGAVCDRYLGVVAGPVGAAIRYSILGGGKRLRPLLVIAAFRAAGGRGVPAGLAAAVEVVHAYSLVHDDLPCMDDDDIRRGRPTTHRVYGAGVAAAAGLAMVPLAARCALAGALATGLHRDACASIVRELMRASGAGGMVGGQLLDLEAEGLSRTIDDLERIHRSKTGALIASSVRLGAIAADSSRSHRVALDRYGASVGLAFQIADDILDATATSDQLGKTAGRDAVLQKSTYPALLGVKRARERAASLAEEACDALEQAGLLTPALDHLARFVVSRQA